MQKDVEKDHKIIQAEDTKGRMQVGFQITKPESAIKLSNITPTNLEEGDTARFNVLYFKTTSGNIYCLDCGGKLIDSERTMRLGKDISRYLPLDDIRAKSITIGRAFDQTSIDGAVVEAVALRKERYSPENMKEMVVEGESSIVREFETRINRPQSASDSNHNPYLRTEYAPKTESIEIRPIDFKKIADARLMRELVFEGQVSSSKNFGGLYEALIKRGPILVGSKLLRPENAIMSIEAVRDGQLPLTDVVDTYGIRKKVGELLSVQQE